LLLLAGLAACGGNGPPSGDSDAAQAPAPELESTRRALTTSVTIEPRGYRGAICFGTNGTRCARNAQAASFPLDTGSYVVRTSFAVSDDHATHDAGVLTVAANGTLSGDAALLKTFDVGAASISAKVADVVLDFNGFKGQLFWYQVATMTGPAATTTLLCSRNYALMGGMNLDLNDSSAWTSPLTYGVKVAEDCSGVTLDVGGTDRSFVVDPTDHHIVRAKITPVTIDFSGIGGYLVWYGVDQVTGPTATTRLLTGRRFGLLAGGAWSLENHDGWLSPINWGVSVKVDGTISLDAGGTDRYFAVNGTTLVARPAQVTATRNGYTGDLCINGLACFGTTPTATLALWPARGYTLAGIGDLRISAGFAVTPTSLPAGGFTVTFGAAASCAGLPENTPCDDSDLCNGREMCRGGTCTRVGAPVDDQNSCTTDTCDPATGVVTHTPDPAREGTSCGGASLCSAAVCRQGTCAPAAEDHCSAGTCSADEVTCRILPTLSCTLVGSGGNSLVFAFQSSSAVNVHVPAGPLNNFGAAGTDLGQPSWFGPGAHSFTVRDPGVPITWTIGTNALTAGGPSAPCSTTIDASGATFVLLGDFRIPMRPDPSVALASSVVASDTDGSGARTFGEISGTFAVSDDGAATYHVPLWVAPGRASIQPALSLDYSSQKNTNHSPLGVGWHLGGLSEIRRCRRTLAEDGEPSGIRFDRTDAYCLDGERLVPLADDRSGPGAEYRTRRDMFARITAVMGADGPTSFTVEMQDGRKRTYGTNSAAHSRLEGLASSLSAPGTRPAILAWGLDREEDKSGNFMTVTYDLIQTSNPEPVAYEWRPARIDYTGNSTTGRTTDRSISFQYAVSRPGFSGGPRPDRTADFVGGLRIENTALLGRITARGPGADGSLSVLRRYELRYSTGSLPSEGTARSRLESIEECDGGNACKPLTSFSYSSASPPFELITTNIGDVAGAGAENYWVINAADYNGDGKDDILYRVITPSGGNDRFTDSPPPDLHEQWVLRLSNGEGFGEPIVLSDVDAGQPNVNATARLPDRGFYAKWNFGIPVDINGDGTVDFAAVKGAAPIDASSTLPPHWRVFSIGRDLSVTWNERLNAAFGLSETSDALFQSGQDTTLPRPLFFVDLNGDGRPEAVRARRINPAQAPMEWAYRANDGVLVGDYRSLGITARTDNLTLAADWDGDGKVDILVAPPNPAPGQFYDAINLDQSGNVQTRPTAILLAQGTLQHRFFDANGDGLPDAVTVSALGGVPTLALGTGVMSLKPQPPPLIPLAPVDPDGFSDNIGNVGFRPENTRLAGVLRESGARVGDLNGDGIPELISMDANLERDSQLGRQGRVVSWVPAWVEAGSGGGGLPEESGFNFNTVFVPKVDLGGGNVAEIPIGKAPLLQGPYASGYVATKIHGIGNPGSRLSQIADVNGDGLLDLLEVSGLPAHLKIYRRRGPQPDLLVSVRRGLGSKIGIEYRPISDPSVYTGGVSAYPRSIARRGFWVVSRHTEDDGLGACPNDGQTSCPSAREYRYTYEDGVTDLRGAGWLGFEKRTISETRTGVVREITFGPSIGWPGPGFAGVHPFARVRLGEVVTTPLGGGVSRKLLRTYHYATPRSPDATAGQPIFAIRMDSTHENETELNFRAPGGSALIRNVYRNFLFEDYYNETYRMVESYEPVPNGEDVTKKDRNVYERWTTYLPVSSDARSKWLLGQLDQVVEKSTIPDGRSALRTTNFVADPDRGFVIQEVREPAGGAELRLVIDYHHNREGLLESVTRTAANEPVRRDLVLYDQATGTYPSHIENAAGHTIDLAYHPGLGVPVGVVDANNLLAAFRSDGFGRDRGIDRQDSADVDVHYGPGGAAPCDGSAASAMSLRFEEKGGTNGIRWGTSRIVCLDRLGRQVIEATERPTAAGASASLSVVQVDYDLLGRPSRLTRPFFQGQSREETTFSYDTLGRLTSRIEAGLFESKMEYVGRVATATDPSLHQRSTVADLLGRVIESAQRLESNAIKTVHGYAPFGFLETVTVGGRAQTTYAPDAWGRAGTIVDRDSGTTTLTYNAFGEIRRRVDGAGRGVTFDLDTLGRVVSSTDQANQATARFVFDSKAGGVGLPGSSLSYDGVVTDWSYDDLSRPHGESRTIGNRSFTATQDYDQFGRGTVFTYPQGTSTGLAINHEYDPITGELAAVKDVTGLTDLAQGRPLWTAVTRDAEGRTRIEQMGLALQRSTDFDSRGLLKTIKTGALGGQPTIQDLSYLYLDNGNLWTRSDQLSHLTETFGYDSMERLTTWQVGGGGIATYDYDDFGNLRSRTSGVGLNLPDFSFTYTGGTSGGQNAVKHSTVSGGGLPTVNSDYTYYGNGAQKSGGGRTNITYAPMGLPSSIEGGGGITSLTYDGQNLRASKVGPDGTTNYFGLLYEERSLAGQSTSHVFHVFADRLVADVVRDSGGNQTVYYLHQDNLGSVETVTLSDGTVKDRHKFDPFGSRIRPADLSVPPGPLSSPRFPAFAGHDEDSDLGLVNMKGRLYDPAQMRFISPDPIVGDPYDGQNWNPYAYVLNSPTNLVDPSGFEDCPSGPAVCTYEDDVIVGGRPSGVSVYPIAMRASLVSDGPVSTVGTADDVQTTGVTNVGTRTVNNVPSRSANPGAGTAGLSSEVQRNLSYGAISGDFMGFWEGAGAAMTGLSPFECASWTCRMGFVIGGVLDALKEAQTEGRFGPGMAIGAGAGRSAAVLDANALMRGIEKGEAAAVDVALAGRQPIVPIQAAKEFLRKGDAGALRSFLTERGGRLGAASSEASAASLQSQARAVGRSLKIGDARVAGSALREGAPVITRDTSFRNFLNYIGIGGFGF
jgi:RHS repeat-associated protein